ncbi:hypothetical protein GXW83_28450 [Streptacidiphilus sp. PB12-B1b]|uniref:MAB_1171c family putative transporter n=1 Tax=Streptacidiphilus sp. PB12-B1b TaxID=2705012 RepID=UPI0015FE04C0|nr:MAB_1171c family putative transporter [Streptacidiphilus sp. PB12-B1b]QMU79052.1 hypothetical protein GXW83_28450 [Streptacidiphilus sp. PB12-B1b]
MNALFLGMAFVLAAAAGYWMLGRGKPRPAGTWAMGSLLLSFGLAFASYAPVVQDAVGATIPHVARLLSNSFALMAATSVVALMMQVNLEPDDARRRIHSCVVILAASLIALTALFAWEQLDHDSSRIHALYLLTFVGSLTFTIVGFLRQALLQAGTAVRGSVTVGLRTAAVGCVFALLYVAYKTTVLVSLGLGYHLAYEGERCSSLVAGSCAFSVTAPALGVLLILVGLTLPAVVYPIQQARRRRWEMRSFDRLGPLWQDLTDASPEIILSDADLDPRTDADFRLQRRVIEISDGLLTLLPYRSLEVQLAAQRAVAASSDSGTSTGSAITEAAVVTAALAALRANQPQLVPAPADTGTGTRAADLRAETEWLLLVADAYAHSDLVRVTNGGHPDPVGA